MKDWILISAAVVQAVSTIVLVLVTMRYAKSSDKMAISAEAQRKDQQSARIAEFIPNLILDKSANENQYRVVNFGNFPVWVKAVTLETIGDDALGVEQFEFAPARPIVEVGERFGLKSLLPSDAKVDAMRDGIEEYLRYKSISVQVDFYTVGRGNSLQRTLFVLTPDNGNLAIERYAVSSTGVRSKALR